MRKDTCTEILSCETLRAIAPGKSMINDGEVLRRMMPCMVRITFTDLTYSEVWLVGEIGSMKINDFVKF